MKMLRQIILYLICAGLFNFSFVKTVSSQIIGMEAYTYRNSFKKDVAATLDTLKSLNIKDIELGDLYGKTAYEFRKLLDDRGLYCSSFGASYKDLISKPREVGEVAQILGAKFIMVAWIPHKSPFTIEDAQKAADDFNKAGKFLFEEFGIKFCYHNHGYEFRPYENGTLFDYLVQKTNPKYVSFEIDILWAFFPGADPSHLIDKYGNRFKLIHLKDLRKGVTGNFSGETSKENDVPLGTGQLNIPSILKAAEKAGIEHYYLEDESPVYYEQVPQSIAYLESLKRINKKKK